MTPQETIKWMEAFKDAYNKHPEEAGEACDLAIDVLKKEIRVKPKKVLRHRGGFETRRCLNCDATYSIDGRYTITEYYCPSCGRLLDSVFRNYCGNCGQAIELEE